MDTPPKKKKIYQTFRNEYSEKFPCISQCKKDSTKAFCKTCNVTFTISHGGLNDIKRHVSSIKHSSAAASNKTTIASFFSSTDNKLNNAVINAEVLFTDFLIEHNLPIAVADHAGPLFRRMFVGSDIAKKYSCARTKSTAIVGHSASEDAKYIINKMLEGPFSIATDGSSDYNDAKLYPILVKYFDDDIGKVMTVLVKLKECVESTGVGIFHLLNNELQKNEVSWSKCISFGADNAMVMMGLKTGVAAHLLKAHPEMYILGCPCHLMHLAAGKAASELPIRIEDLLIDIYFYLDKSSKRQFAIKQFMQEYSENVRKVIKHVSTRWLSLGACIKRLLDQWDGIYAYFQSELEEITKKKEKKELNKAKKADKKCDGKSNMTKEKKTDGKAKKRTHDNSADIEVHPKIPKHDVVVSNKTVIAPNINSNNNNNTEFDISAFIFKQNLVHAKGKPTHNINSSTASKEKHGHDIAKNSSTSANKQKSSLNDITKSCSDGKKSSHSIHKSSTSTSTDKEKSADGARSTTKHNSDKSKSSGNSDKSKSSGNSDKSKSSGNSDKSKSSGNSDKSKSSGNSDKSKSSGNSDKNKSCSNSDKSKSSGNSVKSKSSGNSVKSKSSGNSDKSKSSDQGTFGSYSDCKVNRIVHVMQNPETMAYCLFLNKAITLFDSANTFLQTDEPHIHKLLPTLNQQLTNILIRFIKADCIESYKNRLHEIPYEKSSKQKDDSEIFVGEECRIFLEAHKNEMDLSKFFSYCRSYYIRAVSYMLKKFPYQDELLQHATVADISKRAQSKFTSVKYFVKRFKCLAIADCDDGTYMDRLEEEFLLYQVDDFQNVVLRHNRIDNQWHEISKLKSSDDSLKYPNLSRIMKAILVIFHSNADCERLFSFVTKTCTEFRANISPEALSDLVVHKQFMLSKGSKCYEQEYTTDFLRKAKGATYQKLKGQKEAKAEIAAWTATQVNDEAQSSEGPDIVKVVCPE